MNKLILGLFSILLVGLLVIGCGGDKTSDPVSTGLSTNMANFILPPGATLESATFNINVIGVSGRTVNVHRVTDTWGETTVTWNNFSSAFAPAVYGSFLADAADWRSVDVTALVQEWLNGSYENFGLLLDQADITYPRTFYPSRETTDMPNMEVCYMVDGISTCETIYPLGDTYINEYFPDDNFGLEEVLFTGWAADGELEKQSLFMFEFIPSEEPELASLGDKVWFDFNMNGIQDDGEQGAPGVIVYLFDCTGLEFASTTTDANGNYLFTDLPAGDYYVVFDLPAGYVFSPQNQGGDDALDSDADPQTGMAACTTLDEGENDLTWDAGIYEIPVEDCDECDGKITELTLQYLGDASANVEVVTKKEGTTIFSGMVDPNGMFSFVGDDKKGTMGTEISVYVDGELNVKIHTSCSQPIAIGMIFGDFEIIDGYSRNGGRLCVYDDPGEDPEDPDCGVCDGKITELTLRYLGDSSADIEVVTKKEGSTIFSGMVDADATFNFVGDDKKGTMGTEISIYVDDELNIKIHTSCSQPIEIGMIFGDFEIVDGYSRNGGQICTYE